MTSISPGGPGLEALRDEIRKALEPWYCDAKITMRLAVGETVQYIMDRYDLVPRPDQPPVGCLSSRGDTR